MNKRLLTRIEELEALTKRLEQAIKDIWAACPCLDGFPEPEENNITFCGEPEEPELLEKDDTIYCLEPEKLEIEKEREEEEVNHEPR